MYQLTRSSGIPALRRQFNCRAAVGFLPCAVRCWERGDHGRGRPPDPTSRPLRHHRRRRPPDPFAVAVLHVLVTSGARGASGTSHTACDHQAVGTGRSWDGRLEVHVTSGTSRAPGTSHVAYDYRGWAQDDEGTSMPSPSSMCLRPAGQAAHRAQVTSPVTTREWAQGVDETVVECACDQRDKPRTGHKSHRL